MFKNRYRDVICLDDSRIKLKVTENGHAVAASGGSDESSTSTPTDLHIARNDYIHANYVDGYKQKNAFISTQGPLEETVEDFWRMIWEQQVLVIAMTTKVLEQRKLKCAQYWPLDTHESMLVGGGDDLFEITNVQVQDLEDYRVSQLAVRHLPSGQTRHIVHCQFLSWPDHGVPKTATQILDFIDLVRQHQATGLKSFKWNGHPLGPPICVHCSAGIGRTGTFCAIDISINRLKDRKTVNILDTVNKIRLQRAQSVQMRDQYVFCYLAVIEYAMREKLLDNVNNINLTQLFESLV
jgi:tyrosine-protein phosphatase non-receptor type 9